MSTLLPKFVFETKIDVHISYINYGDHLGNDSFVVLLHEARIRFLKSLGFTERDLGGYGLIVKRLVIEYQEQVYHGDVLTIKIGIGEISRASVRLVYTATNQDGKPVMDAETLIVFFDYEKNKIKKTPEFFHALVSA